MTRNDRLFDILQLLRDGRRHRAVDIAARLGVSPRTIYRDMNSLSTSGVPITGTRGTGYRVAKTTHLPPLELTDAQLEALNLGIAIVAQSTDPDLAHAAQDLAEKFDSILPQAPITEADSWRHAVHPFANAARGASHIGKARAAVRARQKLQVLYHAKDGTLTTRVIRPLRLDYWGRIWTLTAWCETQETFDRFRLDLIQSADALPELFIDEPGKTLSDFKE